MEEENGEDSENEELNTSKVTTSTQHKLTTLNVHSLRTKLDLLEVKFH